MRSNSDSNTIERNCPNNFQTGLSKVESNCFLVNSITTLKDAK